ncbi:hypothetical protein FHG87_004984, partial [Trinorchestia longiramus]
MALTAAAISLVFVFLLPPFVFVLIVVLVSASVGKSIGLRERYVKGLIRIFEFCKTRLAAQRKLSNNEECDSDTESSEDERLQDSNDELSGSGNEVIEREIVLRPGANKPSRSLSGTEDFKLWDPLYYVRTGVEAIVDDEVTKRFSAEELTSWNLLTRTNSRHQFVSLRLTTIWVVGFFVRYCILLPIRISILCVGTGLLVMCTYAVGCLREGAFKKSCNYTVTKQCFDVLSGALSLVCTYHNRQNQPRNGICVANHTSPVDALVLACDNTYDLVGRDPFFGWSRLPLLVHCFFLGSPLFVCGMEAPYLVGSGGSLFGGKWKPLIWWEVEAPYLVGSGSPLFGGKWRLLYTASYPCE